MDYRIESILGEAYQNIIKNKETEISLRVKAVRLMGEHLKDTRVREYLFFIVNPRGEEYPTMVKAEAIRALEPLVPDDKGVVSVLKRKIRAKEQSIRDAAAEVLSVRLGQGEWERVFGDLLRDTSPENVWTKDQNALMDIMSLRWEEKRRHEELAEILAALKKHLP
ncbi:MAG: hypothetical protein AB1814_02415 [Thermodesulfobacteriota bacterium]